MLHALLSGLAGVNDAAAMGQTAVLLLHLLGGNEGHSGVIVREIVGHGLDFLLDAGLVGALSGDDVALAGVLLAGGQLRILAGAHAGDRFRYRHSVLAGIHHALDPADGVGVALAHAAAPEGIGFAARQDGGGVEAVQGEHARIPAAGNETKLARGGCSLVDIGEVLRDVGVGVKGVDHIVEGRILGSHGRKVRGGTAADDEDIQVLLTALENFGALHRHAGGVYFEGGRVPTGVDGRQGHVLISRDGRFHAAAKVAIAKNACFDHLNTSCDHLCIAYIRLHSPSGI